MIIGCLSFKIFDKKCLSLWHIHTIEPPGFIIRKIFKLTFLDTQCGFKYISSKKIKEISNKLSCGGFLYDLDLILFCLNSNINVKEEPVNYYFDKNSSVSLLKDPFIMLKDILILRKKYRI